MTSPPRQKPPHLRHRELSTVDVFEIFQGFPGIRSYGVNAALNDVLQHYCAQVELIPNTWEHDDVIKWKHFPRYLPFVRGIHRSPVNSPHKGQWRGALIFSLICSYIYGWVNNREAGSLRCHRAHHDVIVMKCSRELGLISIYRPSFQICGLFFHKDKTVVKPSYLYNKNPYTDKTASLYWGDPLVEIKHRTIIGTSALIHARA